MSINSIITLQRTADKLKAKSAAKYLRMNIDQY